MKKGGLRELGRSRRLAVSDMAVQNEPVGERPGKEDYLAIEGEGSSGRGKRGGGNCQGRICASWTKLALGYIQRRPSFVVSLHGSAKARTFLISPFSTSDSGPSLTFNHCQ